jgi:uncharacterized protein YjiS (DUF1127 family)
MMMTKEKKFFRYYDIEATNIDKRDAPSSDRNQPGPVNDPGLVNSLVEGYALYAAAIYSPLLMTSMISQQRNVDMFRQPANEQRAVEAMDMTETSNVSVLMANSSTSAQDSLILRSLRGLGRLLLAPCRFYLREREIGKAIDMLSAMDDRSLRDIGLHRSQIGYVVRHGRPYD